MRLRKPLGFILREGDMNKIIIWVSLGCLLQVYLHDFRTSIPPSFISFPLGRNIPGLSSPEDGIYHQKFHVIFITPHMVRLMLPWLYPCRGSNGSPIRHILHGLVRGLPFPGLIHELL